MNLILIASFPVKFLSNLYSTFIDYPWWVQLVAAAVVAIWGLITFVFGQIAVQSFLSWQSVRNTEAEILAIEDAHYEAAAQADLEQDFDMGNLQID